MAVTTLARFNLQNGTPTPVTLDAAFQVSPGQFYLLYTANAVQYGDVFTVSDAADIANLIILAQGGSGSGTTATAILSAGGPNSTFQPEVSDVSAPVIA